MTLEEITPFGDRVLVRPDAKPEQSEGGIHIPQTVQADNPNYYTVSGTVLKLGDGYYEDIYQCCNAQCRYECRRTVGEYCPVCKATQKLAIVDGERKAFDVKVGDRVLFGRFAGKQLEVTAGFWDEPIQVKVLMMREIEILGILSGDERVTPGYQAADFNKPSKGLTPEVTTVAR